MAETFNNRGQKITAAVTAAGTAIDEKLAERGSKITEQLVKHGAQAADCCGYRVWKSRAQFRKHPTGRPLLFPLRGIVLSLLSSE